MPSRLWTMIASLATALFLMTAPAAQAQQSEGYKFLQAVKDQKGDDVTKMLSKPGSNTLINARDYSTGEGALHIVVKRGDATYLKFLLSQDATDPNLRDNQGVTALALAIGNGENDLVDILLNNAWHKADPNVANNSGETPLIVAVHHRNAAAVNLLLKANADPDETDHLAGLSARDYAKQDSRSPVILKMLDAAPKHTRAAVAGPKF
jgi:ankyrin repeat protein